jgi:hypothetical protein
MSVKLASKNELGSVPSLYISWKSLRRVGIHSSLKVRLNSAENPSGPGLFFSGRFFIAASILFCVIEYSDD